MDSYGRAEVTIDGLGGRTTAVFDGYGRQHATIDVFNNRSTVVFDSKGQVEARVDALGNRTTTIFDAYGRAEATINALGGRSTVVFDAYGRVSATVDELGRRTTLLYDAYGRNDTVQDALGNSAIVVFDSYGRVSVTVDQLGRRTTTIFDSNGRYSATVDALNNRATVVYDAFGRVQTSIDQLGNRITTTFDAYGRPESVIDSLANRTTSVFDSKGRVEATINPLGERVTTVFDAYGRVSATVDQLGGRTTAVFDAYGRKQNLIDPVSNKTTFVYDAASRIVQEIDPLGKTSTLAFDAVGHMASATDRLGRRRDFSFDALGRKIGETWVASNGSTVDNRLTFVYDAVGNLTSAADFDGAYTLTYDALNRATTVHDVWGKRLTMTWDAVGNRTQLQDSDGGVIDSTYNAANQLTRRGYLQNTYEQLYVERYYDAPGRLIDERRYNSGAPASLVAATSFTYDAASRLTNLQHKNGSLTNIANYTYVYDNHSRLTSETRNGTTVTYTYDDTNQLTGDGTNSWTYDANGNRTNTGYTTGAANRLTSDGTWTYSYDDNGNLTKKSKGASQETWTYGYDQANHMTWAEKRATDGGTLQLRAEYRYDVFGNRIEKKVDSNGDAAWDTTQRYAYDGWKNIDQPLVGNENWDIWADLDGSSSLTTRYVRGDAIDEVFARSDAGTEYWYLIDRLGSIREVIDNSATVKDALTYSGFGGIASETDASFRGRYAWTGREIDTETGLQRNRERYYQFDVGRFTTEDPRRFAAIDPNLSRYVYNSPTNGTDPSGLTGSWTEGPGPGGPLGHWVGAGPQPQTELREPPTEDKEPPETRFRPPNVTPMHEAGAHWSPTTREWMDARSDSLYLSIDILITFATLPRGLLGATFWRRAPQGALSASRAPALLSPESLALGRQNAASLAQQLRNTPGTTTHALRVAEALESGDIGVNILGERMFETAFRMRGGTGALPASFAYNNQIYIRSTSTGYLSQVVHEGSHGLDFWARHPGVFSNATQAQIHSTEIRAYFFERQFQLSTGTHVDFPSLTEMLKHIRKNY